MSHAADLQDLRLDEFNQKTLLLSVVDEFLPVMESKGLSINYCTANVNEAATADPYVFRQIPTDIFVEIVGHMQQGVIDVLLGSSSCKKNTLILMIEDTKRVIPHETLYKLLSTTHHADSSSVRAKYFTESLGGTLQAESDDASGTAFIVTIPISSHPY